MTDIKHIKRYTMEGSYIHETPIVSPKEDDQGEWIQYEDVKDFIHEKHRTFKEMADIYSECLANPEEVKKYITAIRVGDSVHVQLPNWLRVMELIGPIQPVVRDSVRIAQRVMNQIASDSAGRIPPA